jgi:hypothetical protein
MFFGGNAGGSTDRRTLVNECDEASRPGRSRRLGQLDSGDTCMRGINQTFPERAKATHPIDDFAPAENPRALLFGIISRDCESQIGSQAHEGWMPIRNGSLATWTGASPMRACNGMLSAVIEILMSLTWAGSGAVCSG